MRDSEAILDEPLTVRERIVREAHLVRRENGSARAKTNGYHPYWRNGYAKYHQLAQKEYAGKRMIDLVIGCFGFLAFLVAYPLIAMGIKLSSDGPVLFKQKRTGQNGQSFVCYKFRTMYCVQKRSMNGQPDITEKGDRRVFPFGRFLRRTNLDELPQILNVLKGDMSLVGPRPYPTKECAHWNSTFNDFYYRYSVKPGISGWAQVNGYRGGTLDEEHMRKRLDQDLIYVQKQSLGFDLYIIWKTVLQMLHLNTNAH